MFSNRRVRSRDADPAVDQPPGSSRRLLKEPYLRPQGHVLTDCARASGWPGVATRRTTPPRASAPLIRLRRSWS